MSLAAYFKGFTFTDVRAFVAVVLFIISLAYFWIRGFVKQHPNLKETGRSKVSKSGNKKKCEHSSDSETSGKNIANQKQSAKVSSKSNLIEKEKFNKIDMCNASPKLSESNLQENKNDSLSKAKITAENYSSHHSAVTSSSVKVSHVKNKRKKPGNSLSDKGFETPLVENNKNSVSKHSEKLSGRQSNYGKIDHSKNQDSDSEGAWIEVCRTKKK